MIIKIEDLSPAKGASRKRKRVGCGSSSGHGGTSGRGHKGQKSRSGAKIRVGFEGGQMPLYRRLPSKGFKPRNKVIFTVINVGDLNVFSDGGVVDIEALKEMGKVKGRNIRVKILGGGEIERSLTVKAHSFSNKAKEKIEKAGGKVEYIK